MTRRIICKEGLFSTIKGSRFMGAWFSDKNRSYDITPSKIYNHHGIFAGNNHIIWDCFEANPKYLEFM